MAAGATTTAITTPEGRFTADVAGAAGAPLMMCECRAPYK